MGRRPRGRRHGPYAVGAEDDGRPPPTGRAALILARLQTDPRVRDAALIASTFPGLDPVAVLDERDSLTRLLRLAAHNIVVEEQEKANRAARK